MKQGFIHELLLHYWLCSISQEVAVCKWAFDPIRSFFFFVCDYYPDHLYISSPTNKSWWHSGGPTNRNRPKIKSTIYPCHTKPLVVVKWEFHDNYSFFFLPIPWNSLSFEWKTAIRRSVWSCSELTSESEVRLPLDMSLRRTSRIERVYNCLHFVSGYTRT